MNKIYTMDYSTITAPTEGTVTKRIEKITAKLPSDSFLFAAGGIILLSLATRAMGKEHTSLFFGQWVAPLLLLGVYNKIVKTLGHDQQDRDPSTDDQKMTHDKQGW